MPFKDSFLRLGYSDSIDLPPDIALFFTLCSFGEAYNFLLTHPSLQCTEQVTEVTIMVAVEETVQAINIFFHHGLVTGC